METESFDVQDFTYELCYCVNPACPSYALVQIPAEDMPKEKKVKKG
jgi:hypothetical protein